MNTALATRPVTNALVKPSTIQEQLLGKISEMRQEIEQENLTKEHGAKVEHMIRSFGYTFESLVWKYFKINKQKIQKLSDQELNTLFALVSERAGIKAPYIKFGVYSFLFISIIGWSALLPMILSDDSGISMGNTLDFINLQRKLRKILGDDFDPIKIIRSRLDQ